jgi:hypothetical protein
MICQSYVTPPSRRGTNTAQVTGTEKEPHLACGGVGQVVVARVRILELPDPRVRGLGAMGRKLG